MAFLLFCEDPSETKAIVIFHLGVYTEAKVCFHISPCLCIERHIPALLHTLYNDLCQCYLVGYGQLGTLITKAHFERVPHIVLYVRMRISENVPEPNSIQLLVVGGTFKLLHINNSKAHAFLAGKRPFV